VSIVLPVYNEADVLEASVRKVEWHLKKLGYDYEIIIAEDGSTDGTDTIAARMAHANKRMKHLHSVERLGRGGALKRAFRVAAGDVLVYLDIDLATDLSCLGKLISEIERGYDVSIGSRLLPGSDVKRSLARSVASRCYNALARGLFGTNVHDMQCGFKAFRSSMMPAIIAAQNNHWFWDTETLLIAEASGAAISEVPVAWREINKSKVKIVKDAFDMGFSLVKLRTRLKPVAMHGSLQKVKK
ncbi:MAG: dolichyl-phosphate beta-glucosyltransferase, partial [Candidatus Aenigmatarchaeota archaeon]